MPTKTQKLATEIQIEHDDTLQQLFHGGTPVIALCDFISQTFRTVDFISPTIKAITKNAYAPSVSGRVLPHPGYCNNFDGESHGEWG